MGRSSKGMAGVAALAAAYFLSQFYRSFLPVLYPALQRDIGLDADTLSNASGAWFLVFAFAQFPIGWSLDRYGPRMTAAVLLAIGGGGGAALFAAAQAPWVIIVAMGFIGLGCAPVLMASFFIYAREFRPDRFATYAATLVGVGTLGNVFAAAPLSALSEAVGWRAAALGLAAVTLLVAIACGLLVRNPAAIERKADAPKSGLRDVLALRALWPIMPLMFVSYAASANIRGAWAGPFLSELYGMDAAGIGQATLFMAIAMAVGSITYGPLDRVFRSQKWVVFTGNVIVIGACMALAAAPAGSVDRAIALFVVIGLAGASYSIIMAHGRSFLPPEQIGRGVTLLNFFSIAGSGVIQILSGKVLSLSGGATAGADAFANVFWFYTAALVGAAAIYLFSQDYRAAKPASAS